MILDFDRLWRSVAMAITIYSKATIDSNFFAMGPLSSRFWNRFENKCKCGIQCYFNMLQKLTLWMKKIAIHYHIGAIISSQSCGRLSKRVNHSLLLYFRMCRWLSKSTSRAFTTWWSWPRCTACVSSVPAPSVRSGPSRQGNWPLTSPYRGPGPSTASPRSMLSSSERFVKISYWLPAVKIFV